MHLLRREGPPFLRLSFCWRLCAWSAPIQRWVEARIDSIFHWWVVFFGFWRIYSKNSRFISGEKAVYEAEWIKGLQQRSHNSPSVYTADIWANLREWTWSLMALSLFSRHKSSFERFILQRVVWSRTLCYRRTQRFIYNFHQKQESPEKHCSPTHLPASSSRCYPGSDECYLHYKVPVEQNKTQTNTLRVALH